MLFLRLEVLRCRGIEKLRPFPRQAADTESIEFQGKNKKRLQLEPYQENWRTPMSTSIIY